MSKIYIVISIIASVCFFICYFLGRGTIYFILGCAWLCITIGKAIQIFEKKKK